jgi:hypothetical protein
LGIRLGVTSSGDGQVDSSPYDGLGRVDVRGWPGWRYLPFAAGTEGGPITITAEGPDGLAVTFSVPTYVSRGDELREITGLVIRARIRMERAAGVGS